MLAEKKRAFVSGFFATLGFLFVFAFCVSVFAPSPSAVWVLVAFVVEQAVMVAIYGLTATVSSAVVLICLTGVIATVILGNPVGVVYAILCLVLYALFYQMAVGLVYAFLLAVENIKARQA